MKILYAEDERSLSMAVSEILKMNGYEVHAVYDGQEALDNVLKNSYDAAVFDIMMPKLDGVSVLEEMRKAQIFIPVILLTAKAEVEDRIAGLRAGADDYLAKPFSMGELVARIDALTRRNNTYVVKNVKAGNVELDCENNQVSTPMGALVLSAKETALLAHFMQNPDVLMDAQRLLNVLNTDDEDDMAVTLYIAYLKNKLRQIRADMIIEQENDAYRMILK